MKLLIMLMFVASSSGALFSLKPNGVVIYKIGKEVLEMETEKGIERFHLPAVKGSNQADIIHDFNKKLSMHYFPDIKACYLSPLDTATQLSPLNLVTFLKKASRIKKTLTKSKEKWTVLRQIKSSSSLTSEMATLCANVPIYRVKVSADSDSKGRFRRGCITVTRTETYKCKCYCVYRWFVCHKRCHTCKKETRIDICN